MREVIRSEGDAQQGVLENDDALVGKGEARMYIVELLQVLRMESILGCPSPH